MKTTRSKTGRRLPKSQSRKKTVKTTISVPVRKAKPAQRATILDVVNRLLNRKTESKYLAQSVTTQTLPNGIAPFAPGVWENIVQQVGQRADGQYWQVALPAQVQGLTDQTRIGDRIEPLSHRVKMTVRFAEKYLGPDTYVAMDSPLDVTVYVFYGYIKSLKTYQTFTQIKGNSVVVGGQNEAVKAMNNLLDDGDGTFSTFTGSQILANLPLSSYVNMKVKKIHLRRGGGYINTNAGNGGAVPNTDSQNTISKTFTLKFKTPAKLEYKTSTDTYPENYAPVFALGYVFNDSTAGDNQGSPVYSQGQVEYTALAQMWYKDHQ